MTTLAWTTDPHLNFVSDFEFDAFVGQVETIKASAMVITGDIAEAPSLVRELQRLYKRVKLPIYYVLGNHDFYRGSIQETRRTARKLALANKNIVWLRDQVVPLNETWGMVGVDGWGDARHGNCESSPVELNDQRLIAEFHAVQASLIYREKLHMCRRFGDEEAAALRKPLFEALATFPKVLVLTHVPPFAEATWHEGEHSEPNWLPWFSCKAVGDLLLEAAQAHPDKQIRVLCGHTHGQGHYQALPNLEVRTGEANYRDAIATEVAC